MKTDKVYIDKYHLILHLLFKITDILKLKNIKRRKYFLMNKKMIRKIYKSTLALICIDKGKNGKKN